MRPPPTPFRFGATLLSALLVSACGEDPNLENFCLLCPGDGTPPPVDEWSITPEPELILFDTVQFNVTLRDRYGAYAEGPFDWTSRDTVALSIDDGLAVGGAPGFTHVDVVHVPDGKAIGFLFTVLPGDAPIEPVGFSTMDGPCGVDVEGVTRCWGSGAVLGLGYDPGGRSTATPVAGDHAFIEVGATDRHACGLTGVGRVYCWGDNAEMPLGTSGAGLAPAEVVGAPLFASLQVGSGEICGVTASRDAYCWGRTPAGRREQPTALGADIQWDHMAPGDGESSCDADDGGTLSCRGHSCGLDAEGVAYCWGSNQVGQLGDGTRADRAEPAPVAGTRRYREIAVVPDGYSCALDSGGQLYCWGRSPGVGESWLEPTLVPTIARFQRLSAGRRTICGLDDDGTPYCWGEVWTGRKDPSGWVACPTELVAEPTAVPTELAFTSVSVGHAYACGLTAEGFAYCWGCNEAGHLGTGTFEGTTAPDQRVVRLR